MRERANRKSLIAKRAGGEGKKMINVGIAGYGYWGPNLVRNFAGSKSCKIISICELDTKKWVLIKKKYPHISTTKDYQKLINSPKIDAIVIATPVFTHYPLAKQALEKKKHIFVEKPLATKVTQVQELVDLAKENGCILFVDHTFEYSPAVIKIKEILDSGEIGKIHYISSSRINLGLHQKDVNVVYDLAPHDFSILFYWLDKEPIEVSVIGKGFIRKRIPDVGFINMKFPSGITANIHISWLSPIKLRRTIIIGSKKMIVYDDTELIEKVKIYNNGVTIKEPEDFGQFQLSYKTGNITSPRLETYEPLNKAVNHFLECIELRKKPKTDGENALRVVRALESAERSLIANGKPNAANRISQIEYTGELCSK